MNATTPSLDTVQTSWDAHRDPDDTLAWAELPASTQNAILTLVQSLIKAAQTESDWVSLSARTPQIGDEVRCTRDTGITVIATVGQIDDDGELFTAEGLYLGDTRYGDWSTRHAAVTYRRLPTDPDARILWANGPGGITCAAMRLDDDGFWAGWGGDGSRCIWAPRDIRHCVLDDGTHLERDGLFEDDTLRFRQTGD